MSLTTWVVLMKSRRMGMKSRRRRAQKATVRSLHKSRLDGVAIMARDRKTEAKRLATKHLKEAVEKLPRDWSKTTSNWDVLTTEEQAVLAQDTKALKQMRVTGWNLGTSRYLYI
jgi:hypothetical protein